MRHLPRIKAACAWAGRLKVRNPRPFGHIRPRSRQLVGQRMVLDGQVAEIRGTVSKLPAGKIVAGELIELLVAEVDA